MLLSDSFLLHCPLTSKFLIHFPAEHFRPYTAWFLYVYSSLPLHMELQILEFNKSIMKLQEILNEKLVFSELYHAHNILYFWKENGDSSMKIHNAVTFLRILTMKKVRIKQIMLSLAITRRFFAQTEAKKVSVPLRIFITSDSFFTTRSQRAL